MAQNQNEIQQYKKRLTDIQSDHALGRKLAEYTASTLELLDRLENAESLAKQLAEAIKQKDDEIAALKKALQSANVAIPVDGINVKVG